MNTTQFIQSAAVQLTADTFDFYQAGLKDGIAMLASAAGARYIVSGCQLTPTTTGYSVAVGIVVLDGEPCRVAAHAVAVPAPNPAGYGLRWAVQDTASSTLDPTPLQDGSTASIHRVRTAHLVYTSLAGFGGIPLQDETNMPTFAELVQGLQNGLQESWRPFDTTGNPPLTSSFDGATPAPAFRITPQGQVQLRGRVSLEDASPTYPVNICTLPVGYRPTTALRLPAATQDAGTGAVSMAVIDILTDGRVRLSGPSGVPAANFTQLSLDSVSFSTL